MMPGQGSRQQFSQIFAMSGVCPGGMPASHGWHSEGCRFEPDILHSVKPVIATSYDGLFLSADSGGAVRFHPRSTPGQENRPKLPRMAGTLAGGVWLLLAVFSRVVSWWATPPRWRSGFFRRVTRSRGRRDGFNQAGQGDSEMKSQATKKRSGALSRMFKGPEWKGVKVVGVKPN
jgi:hypothetical protein